MTFRQMDFKDIPKNLLLGMGIFTGMNETLFCMFVNR